MFAEGALRPWITDGLMSSQLVCFISLSTISASFESLMAIRNSSDCSKRLQRSLMLGAWLSTIGGAVVPGLSQFDISGGFWTLERGSGGMRREARPSIGKRGAIPIPVRSTLDG